MESNTKVTLHVVTNGDDDLNVEQCSDILSNDNNNNLDEELKRMENELECESVNVDNEANSNTSSQINSNKGSKQLDVNNKEEAVSVAQNLKTSIENECNNVLINNGFSYKANVKICNEFFPTRTYVNTTLESGYYDAVIVELGDAVGDNWWCVMYPPLCFVNKNENNMQIKYKSKIFEWIKSIFK